jgi:hypothetical protein
VVAVTTCGGWAEYGTCAGPAVQGCLPRYCAQVSHHTCKQAPSGSITLLLHTTCNTGALGVQPVVKALFADPWPEALALKFQATLQRRMRATPALAPWVMQLSAALAAATPGSLPCYSLQALWEAAPG